MDIGKLQKQATAKVTFITNILLVRKVSCCVCGSQIWSQICMFTVIIIIIITRFSRRSVTYIHTVSRITFHHYLITTSIAQQHMCVMLPKVKQSAFTQASFSNLFDVLVYKSLWWDLTDSQPENHHNIMAC